MPPKSFYDQMRPYFSKLAEMKNSLYIWGLSEENLQVAQQIKDALSSSFIFFTDAPPRTYEDRRSLHLELGV